MPHPPVPILMYHEVVTPGSVDALSQRIQRGYLTGREQFAAHLRMLADEGFTPIGLERLARAADAGADEAPWPRRPIVISFDDGFAGNYEHALPLLREHGFTATFFVVSARIGQDFMMSWEQLGRMAQAGMSIESHTANHPLLSTLDAAATRAELADSRAAIEARVGTPVRFLSLPNGDRNPDVTPLARECGYHGVCGSRFGYNDAGADRWDWRRIAIHAGTDTERLRRLATRAPLTVAAQQARAGAKRAVAGLLGKANYDRLYNRVFGVAEQDARKQP